jgi:hypothetical protein
MPIYAKELGPEAFSENKISSHRVNARNRKPVWLAAVSSFPVGAMTFNHSHL